MNSSDLSADLQAIVDTRIGVIDAGEYMLILRILDGGGCEFLSPTGEWVAEQVSLVRLIAVVPTKEKPYRACALTEFTAAVLDVRDAEGR